MRYAAALLAAAALCWVAYVEQPHDCAIWNVADGGCMATGAEFVNGRTPLVCPVDGGEP